MKTLFVSIENAVLIILIKNYKKIKKSFEKLLTKEKVNGIIICRIKMALLSMQFF